MTKSFIKLQSLTTDCPHNTCHILQIDTTRILLNIGSHNLSANHLLPHNDLITSCTAVLISHFDLKYIGALPFLTRIPYIGPIFTTVPIHSLGKYTIQEINNDRFGSPVYTDNEVDTVFSNITQLKYSQPVEISSRLTVTAYRSGNSIGGTIWKISKDNENILVCLGINHRREMHLDGLDIQAFEKISVCIVDVNNRHRIVRRNDRDKLLGKLVSRNTIVFVPVKFTRFLEFMCVLNPILVERNMKAHVYSNYGEDFNRTVRTMVEWEGENVVRDFNGNKNVPFKFERVYFNKLENILDDQTEKRSEMRSEMRSEKRSEMRSEKRSEKWSEGVIYITLDDSLDYSFSRMVLKNVCGNKDNLILFVNEGRKESLQGRILAGDRKIVVDVPSIVPFTGEEIVEAKKLQDLKSKKEEEEKRIAEYLKEKEEDSEDGIYFQDTDLAKKMFWYEYKCDFWVGNDEKYAVFPEKKSLRFDEYGEVFTFKEDKKENEKVVECVSEDKETGRIKYEKNIVEQMELEIKCRIEYLDFDGVCEFQSIRNILEKISPQRIVFLSEQVEISEFYYHYFKLNNKFEEVFYLKDELNLSIEENTSVIKLTEEFNEKILLKRIGDKYVGGFKGKINMVGDEYVLEYTGRGEGMCVGEVKIMELKKMIIEKGLKVEFRNNVIVVEDELEVVVEEGRIVVMGMANDLYFTVKNILYENIAFLN